MRRAFVVGCGKFTSDNVRPLRYAAADARAFVEVVKDPSVMDAGAGCVWLENPTRDELRRKLVAFLRELRDDDEFVFYFAGHARRLPSGTWAFYCTDTLPDALTLTAFSFSDLTGLLRQYRRQRGILIIDTCYAASAQELRQQTRAGEGVQSMMPPQRDGLYLLWACGAEDVAFERDGHGLFTGWLLRALRCGAGVPAHVEWVSPADVITWIRRQLRECSIDQQLWPGFRGAGQTKGLYLSKNPSYRGDRTGTGAAIGNGNDDLIALTKSLAEDLGLADSETQAHFDAHRLLDRADACNAWKPNPFGPDRPQRVVVASPGHIFMRWVALGMGGAIAAALVWWLHPIAGVAIGALFVIGVVGTVLDEWRVLAHHPHHFVLVSEEGFADSKLVDGVIHVRVVPWQFASKLGTERFNETPLGQLTVEVSAPAPFVRPVQSSGEARPRLSFKAEGREDFVYQDENAAHRGQVRKIEQALQWGRTLRLRRLAALEGRDSARPDAKASIGRPRPGISACLWGTSTYQHLDGLLAPARDCQRFATLLTTHVPDAPTMCVDKPLAQCEQTIGAFFARARGITALLYYAGHGLFEHDELFLSVPESDPVRPAESWFAVSKLLDLMLEQRVGHLVLILDCCCAAGGARGLGVDTSALTQLQHVFERDKENITILAAASATEVACERDGKGLFTSAIIDASEDLLRKGGNVRVADLIQRLSTSCGTPPCHLFASNAGFDLSLFTGADRAAVIRAGLGQAVATDRMHQVEIIRRIAQNGETAIPPGTDACTFHCVSKKRPIRAMVTGCFVTLTALGLAGQSGFFTLFGAIGFLVSVYPFFQNEKVSLTFTEFGVILRRLNGPEIWPASEIESIRGREWAVGTHAGDDRVLHGRVLTDRTGKETTLFTWDEPWQEPFALMALAADDFDTRYTQDARVTARHFLKQQTRAREVEPDALDEFTNLPHEQNTRGQKREGVDRACGGE